MGIAGLRDIAAELQAVIKDGQTLNACNPLVVRIASEHAALSDAVRELKESTP